MTYKRLTFCGYFKYRFFCKCILRGHFTCPWVISNQPIITYRSCRESFALTKKQRDGGGGMDADWLLIGMDLERKENLLNFNSLSFTKICLHACICLLPTSTINGIPSSSLSQKELLARGGKYSLFYWLISTIKSEIGLMKQYFR